MSDPKPQAEEVAPGDAAPEADRSLDALLADAQAKLEEQRGAWLRALADAENARKRAQADIAQARKYAAERVVEDLLPVMDSLEAALAVDNATAESLKSGVDLTLKQLNSVFGKFNLSEINPAGEKFDPHRHQAISTIESDEAEPNTVLRVLQKGYFLHERVIRPALVTVSKQKNVES